MLPSIVNFDTSAFKDDGLSTNYDMSGRIKLAIKFGMSWRRHEIALKQNKIVSRG